MNRNDLLNILTLHKGHERGITADELAAQASINARQVRQFVAELREEGIAICATPRTGYFLAETPEELEESCKFLHDRAMRSLKQASRMQKISMPELIGQLKLDQA